jgi:8-oxo-dGTP pyrophosphatase MutT (NUDIX family)
VLVPLFVRGGELTVTLTLRSADLRAHSGQWSFPGGRVDDADLDVPAAATREAEEEIGLEPSAVHVLGLLGDVPTPTGYTITPVVGWIDPPPAAYRPNPIEVTEIFELPLSRLRQPGVVETMGEIARWGKVFRMLAYRVDGRNIWGATARILSELLEVLG